MKKTLSVLFIVAMTISLSCSQTPDKESKSEISEPKPEFETLTHNFGKIIKNDPASFDFVFKNTGNEPLLITNVRSSCGCTTPYWPNEAIKPDEDSKITVKYNTTRIGSFSKSVTVTFQGIAEPVILRISGEVTDFVQESNSPL